MVEVGVIKYNFDNSQKLLVVEMYVFSTWNFVCSGDKLREIVFMLFCGIPVDIRTWPTAEQKI